MEYAIKRWIRNLVVLVMLLGAVVAVWFVVQVKNQLERLRREDEVVHRGMALVVAIEDFEKENGRTLFSLGELDASAWPEGLEPENVIFRIDGDGAAWHVVLDETNGEDRWRYAFSTGRVVEMPGWIEVTTIHGWRVFEPVGP